MKELEFLREQQVDKGLIEGVEEFRVSILWRTVSRAE